MQNNQGYIALVTVLIISSVALVIAATVSLLGIGVEQSALSGSKGENALEFTEGCAEDALLKSQQSSSYNGGNITRPEGTCIISIQKNGNNWTITSTSDQTSYNRTVQVQFVRTTGSPIAISSWQESLPVLTPIPTPTLTPTPTPSVPPNWYAGNNNWMYRQAITIHATKISGTQNNFPVLINLASNTGLKNHAQSSGNDILFTDSTGLTKIPHQIESYTSGTGALIAWVKVPSINSTTDTTIYMYYGNSSPTNQQDVANVWDSNYKAVLHMNEASGNVADSTSNANNGISSNTTSVAGYFAKARSFSGVSTSNIQITDNATLDFGANANYTTSMWFNTIQGYVYNNYPTLIWKETYGTPRQGYSTFMCGTCGNNQLSNEIYTNGGAHYTINANNYNDSNWHYVVSERSGSTLLIYVDGSLVQSGGAASTDISNSSNVILGTDQLGNGLYNGKEQEVRVSNIARSASWITTEYNNQNSPATFYSIAAEEGN